MRALILFLSLVVVGLSGSIVWELSQRTGTTGPVGEMLVVSRFLQNAGASESAEYVSQGGRFLAYRIVNRLEVPDRPLRFEIEVARQVRRQQAAPGEAPVKYVHDETVHGIFPLMAPEAPERLDRVWIIRSIRREEIVLEGESLMTWRYDLIDPALDPAAEAIVAWYHEDAPVFGLVRFKRRDETYELTNWKPKR